MAAFNKADDPELGSTDKNGQTTSFNNVDVSEGEMVEERGIF